VIAGNACNAFCLGELGSPDDFFLVGAEPDPDSNFPMLTGNFLNSEGELLFRIVRNVLELNPGMCSKAISDHLGYQIHDRDGATLFAVRTEWSMNRDAQHPDAKLETTISGNFYDKSGKVVFKADSGKEDERIDAETKLAFGFQPPIGLSHSWGLSDVECRVVAMALNGRGAVYQSISGHHVDEEIELNGKLVIDAVIERCKLHVRTPQFVLFNSVIRNCEAYFYEDMARLRTFILMLNETRAERA
jgi:hypothetical protein